MNNYRQIMKTLACMAFMLLPFTGIAQNYQCLQPGVKHYFTNSNGYLRSIRIDSVRTYADSTVFYPFHTSRGRFYTTNTLDTTSGSWLGKRVNSLPGGTSLFPNMWNDTVVIKTQAHTGDTWHLYDDATALYYQAEVLAEDTMTVLGVADSVKKILVTAWNVAGHVTTDPADSLQLVIGKNSGFVQVFDLYTFPYHAPDSAYAIYAIDYFLDYLGAPGKKAYQFALVPFHWPTSVEMYNWDIGDAYEYKVCQTLSGSCSYPYSFRYDSIVGKAVFPDSVTYQVVGWEIEQHWVGVYYPDIYYPYWKSDKSRTFTVANTAFFNTVKLPEETDQPDFYWYFPGDDSHCMVSPRYRRTANHIVGQHAFVPFDGGHKSEDFKLNFGSISYEATAIPIGTGTEIEVTDDLVYSSRGGVRCGSYTGPEALAVRDVTNAAGTISLSPNPAGDVITIASSEKIKELVITDLVGQVIYKSACNTYSVHVDISRYPLGMYIARMNGLPVKFIRQ